MTWKKFFSIPAPEKQAERSAYEREMNSRGSSNHAGFNTKHSNLLPEVYAGHPNRIERYMQFYDLDQDPQISGALNIYGEFCTQKEEKTGMPFEINFHDDATEQEIEVLKTSLRQWISLNKLDRTLFEIMRNTLLYGDQFFIRDPETFKWLWINPIKVDKVIVDETKGKKPTQYHVRDLSLNLQNLSVTPITTSDMYAYPGGFPRAQMFGGGAGSGGGMYYGQPPNPYFMNSRFSKNQTSFAIEAEHIVHFSHGTEVDANWPFGTSILEKVFKAAKQKQLIEDAIIIYRVSRAPERRIFHIDVGDMPANKALMYLERVKNEMYQRRMPSRTSGGASIMDASYNTMGINDDFFLARSSTGRGSDITTLPAGQNLGEIADLQFWDNLIARGLGIPSSYMPTGPNESTQGYSDGKMGSALIQEFRFNQSCLRVQSMLVEKFDTEFKLFLKWKGVNVEANLFDLQFNPPQNFGKYRQVEIDTAQISVMSSMMAMPHMSKRFVMKRYGGMTEEEIVENERMWREENPKRLEQAKVPEEPQSTGGDLPGMREIGFGSADLGANELDPGSEFGDDGLDLGDGEAAIGGPGAAPAPTPPGAPPGGAPQ